MKEAKFRVLLSLAVMLCLIAVAGPAVAQHGEAEEHTASEEPEASGEHEEWAELYPAFAATAREEGFKQIAAVFDMISIAEKQHEKRYRDLLNNLNAGKVFKKDGKVTWRCRNCGFIHEAAEAPRMCPACDHPQAHFEVLGENW